MMATRALTREGMGSYAPVPHLPQSVIDTAVDTIVKPVLEGMIQEGRPYLGILYAGLILTADGPKVIEFNARFGDPETQIILPRLTSDFAQNITDILDGKDPKITWTDKGVTLGVVVASNGYPLDYEKGVKLPAKTEDDIITYYAGAKFAENSRALLSNGGRVYMLVTTADTVKEAKKPSTKNYRNKKQRPLLPNRYRKQGHKRLTDTKIVMVSESEPL